DWSRGAVISKRLLFVLTRSAAGCQFVESRLATDSRKNPADGSGQERVRAELLCATPRRMPAEAQVLGRNETPAGLPTTRSSLPSWLKSTATRAESPAPAPNSTGASKVPLPLPKSSDKEE